MFKSLRSRSIFGGLVAVSLLFSIALYGRVLFERATSYGKEISIEHNELSRIVNALKSPILDIESNLYLYSLVLTDTQKLKAQLYIEEVLFQLKDLKENNLVKQNPRLVKDVDELSLISLKIETFAKTLFSMTRRDRYPALTIVADQLPPNNERFLAAFQIADFEAEELIDEPGQFNIKNKLSNLKYVWGQLISTTRVLISARTGVFGNPELAMEIVQKNLVTYSQLVDSILDELEILNEKGELGIQQASVLGDMTAVQDFRKKSLKKLIKILHSDRWRHDTPLIMEELKPLFEQAQGALTLIERRLDMMTAFNLKKTAEASRTLSQFLWLFSGFVLLVFLLMYLIFEFWLRRPIVNVAEAMGSVGRGDRNVSLDKTGLQEVDALVSAFSLMQQQINTRQQHLTSILENAGDGIITIDDKGTIESFNTAAEDIFGYREKELIGNNVKLLMPQPNQDKHDGYLKRYRDSGGSSTVMGLSRELEGQTKDGRVFPMYLTTSVIFLGSQRKFIGVIQDITEQKNYQLKLHKAKEKAERDNVEIKQKNREIQLSIDQLKQAQGQLVESEKMASLGGLVAGVAHEINTPIGIGVTATSHMVEELKVMKAMLDSGDLTQSGLEEFYQEATDATHILLNNLNRAADLVRSFKQVAVDQSSEEKRLFNVAEYLDEILLNLRPQLKKTQHEVIVDCAEDLAILSLPGAFSQIFTNLIMNSLIHAFTDVTKGVINIKISKQKNTLTIVHSDNGKGMSDDIVKNVFQPFYTTRRGDGGSGLGMHILYNLVSQTLQGRVTCSSTPGKGTEFTIEIPID